MKHVVFFENRWRLAKIIHLSSTWAWH